jgi:tetratricopeptide (TPR) repeat protein
MNIVWRLRMSSFSKKILFTSLIILFIFFFSLVAVPFVCGQDGFWVPADPPQCHYIIDARIDLIRGIIEGKQRVTLMNDSDRPIHVVALDWNIGEAYSFDIQAAGRPLELMNFKSGPSVSSPLFYRLSEPLKPGSKLEFNIAFKKSFESQSENAEFGATHWYPRIWWDGLPVHDSFSVKLDIPEGYALAVSGRLNQETGRYEIDGARTFGVYLGKNQMTKAREAEGILVTALSTEKGAECASVCLDTAVDAIRFYKDWLGFYPFEFLYIIPGGRGRWGGYPFATGIVVIHGQETFKKGESLQWWQRITAHEIGHEYWGEYVLDPDEPAWVWIGMGIFADTEYILAQKIDSQRRAGWMDNYIQGVSMHYDTTVDIPPAQLRKINYDHNNTVIHSKGFSIISALDSVLGRDIFERIYKKCLRICGGQRLSWRKLQMFYETESGQDLDWFFDQWVRSNTYLCYKIESQESRRKGNQYLTEVRVKRLGTMRMPVPVKAVFEDATEQAKVTERNLDVSVLTFASNAKLKEVILNPENKLAMVENPLPEISEEAAEMLSFGWRAEDSLKVYETIKEEAISNSNIWYSLGMNLYEDENFSDAFDCFERVSQLQADGLFKFAALGWMGLIKDLLGERQQAVVNYKEALKYDTGEQVGYSWLRIQMNRKWLEDRLKTPFKMETTVEIPAQPTAEQLMEIVDDLNWEWEGKTPFLIYEKAENLNIDKYDFWLKLAVLLFDSGYYPEAFTGFEKVFELESSKLVKFTALTWMGHLKDLLGEREEAIEYYTQALEYDTGETMRHDQFRMRINREWVEKRLKVPFTWKKR